MFAGNASAFECQTKDWSVPLKMLVTQADGSPISTYGHYDGAKLHVSNGLECVGVVDLSTRVTRAGDTIILSGNFQCNGEVTAEIIWTKTHTYDEAIIARGFYGDTTMLKTPIECN